MHVTAQMLRPLIGFMIVVGIAVIVVWRMRGARVLDAKRTAAELRAAQAFEDMSMLTAKLRKQLREQQGSSPEAASHGPSKPLVEMYPGPKRTGGGPERG